MFWNKPRDGAGGWIWITADWSSQTSANRCLLLTRVPQNASRRSLLPSARAAAQSCSLCWAARAAPWRGSPAPAGTDATSHIHSPWHRQAVSPGDSSAVMALAARAQSRASAAEPSVDRGWACLCTSAVTLGTCLWLKNFHSIFQACFFTFSHVWLFLFT